MQSLFDRVPTAEILTNLPAEELAGIMLFIIKEQLETSNQKAVEYQHLLEIVHCISTNQDYMGLDREGYVKPNIDVREYPPERSSEVVLSVSEAWAWLVAQGLMIQVGGGYFSLSRRASKFENDAQFADYATSRLLQRDMLHPSIASAAWQAFIRSDYPVAVFQAMRQVEIAVREAAGFTRGEHGVPMIRRAFGRTGPLADPDAEVAEQEALCALFAGAIGAYKNPHSHRHVLMESAREAAEIVMMGSHLLRVVDQAARAKAEREQASG